MVVLRGSGAANSVGSLPPCGGGLGRGVGVWCATFAVRWTPTPNPSPQGGGEHTARVASSSLDPHIPQPYNSSFNLYRMIFPDPVRGIASIRCTAAGTL